jgi:phosphoribosylformylglycinamidine synthase subunit PurQ / glutaminase
MSLESAMDSRFWWKRGFCPGALMRNAGLKFICRTVPLTVATADSVFTAGYAAGATIRLPIAHHDGNYYADAALLDELRGEDRVAFRYGEPVNGSADDIAGILSANRRVLGPHAAPRTGGGAGPRRHRRGGAVPVARHGGHGRRLRKTPSDTRVRP